MAEKNIILDPGTIPADARALTGIGEIERDDGHRYELFRALDSYANVCAVERALRSPDWGQGMHPEDAATQAERLAFVVKEQAELKVRILRHFAPEPGALKARILKESTAAPGRTIDVGLKAKVLKAMTAAENGTFDSIRWSRLKEAIFHSINYRLENGRMPTNGELRAARDSNGKLRFNKQQASDCKAWFQANADTFPELREGLRGRKALPGRRGLKVRKSRT